MSQAAYRFASSPATDRLNATAIRRIILDSSRRANVGHIGSCLCLVEILVVLYNRVLRIASPEDPDRDRFILSKGHGALALYASLLAKGWLSEAALETFCSDDSELGVHPEWRVSGVDFSTGSLGHGLSIAAGAALAARLQGSSRRTFCLISDGECNEGSVWEAAMFASHHRLGHLTVIVDCNGQQAMGKTQDVLNQSNLGDRWRAFGWRVSEVDGHALSSLELSMRAGDGDCSAPHIVIARTVFGKGVSFMEQGVSPTRPDLPVQPVNWHYLPMSEVEYQTAIRELGAGS